MTKVEVLLEKMKGKQALAKHIALNKRKHRLHWSCEKYYSFINNGPHLKLSGSD